MFHNIKITPCPKPRMTQSDCWKKRPAVLRYWAYCDELKLKTRSIEFDPEFLCLVFIMPMPQSWSKKKKALNNGLPHKSRPDLSNLVKAFEDALYKEDSMIHTYGAMRKIWGEEGAILINTLAIEDDFDIRKEK